MTAVCSSTPGDGQRINCTEGTDSTADINISLQDGVSITTTGEREDGIKALHTGIGDVTISVKGKTGRKTISTSGAGASGVLGHAFGKGSADVTVEDVDITLTGTGQVWGIYGGAAFVLGDHAPYAGNYNARVNVRGSRVSVDSASGSGIRGSMEGKAGHALNGSLEMSVTDTDISVAGELTSGIHALARRSSGDVTVNVTGGTIAMPGSGAKGILLQLGHSTGSVPEESGDASLSVTNATVNMTHVRDDNNAAGNSAIVVQNHAETSGNDLSATLTNTNLTGGTGIIAQRTRGSGNVTVTVDGGAITTNGPLGYSIYGSHSDTGNVVIDTRETAIETKGTMAYSTGTGNFSIGIWAQHHGNGNVDIDARGGSIRTVGPLSYGILGDQFGSPTGSDASVNIATHDGHEIATTGSASHGIVAYQRGMGESRDIAITVGVASRRAVRMRSVSSQEVLEVIIRSSTRVRSTTRATIGTRSP